MEPIYHSYLENPLLGAINSIILLLGFYQFGKILININILKKIVNDASDIKYQSILVSVNFFLLILYPLLIFNIFGKEILIVVSSFIFLLGIIRILIFLKKNFKINQHFFEKNLSFYLILFLILGYFLLSLAPVTNADSLDYHLFVGKYIFHNGEYPTDINYFSSRLAGAGEILTAIGLVFGSEQFGSLIQFSGILSIFGILKKKTKNKIFFLVILSSPVLVFLVSSLKPQLFHIASNALIFSLFIFPEKEKLQGNKDYIFKVIFSAVILTVSVQSKFSFLLSSSMLGLLILYSSFFKKKIFSSLLIFFTFFTFFYLPILYWKVLTYGGNIIELFYSPVTTNIHGYWEFRSMLKNVGSAVSYLWIILPVDLKNLTQTLGFGSVLAIYALLNFKKNKKYESMVFVLSFLFVSYFIGQNTARFFLEPLIWFAIILSSVPNFTFHKIFNLIIKFQAVIVLCMVSYGVFTLTPGILTKNLRDEILEKRAIGYSFFKWVNHELKNETNKSVIYFHRQIGWTNNVNNTISSDFTYYIFPDYMKAEPIYKHLHKKKPSYAAFAGFREELIIFKNCLKNLYKYKKNVGHHATRNPFATGSKFDGHIYEIDALLFPECIDISKTKWMKNNE